jgi:hypothetical protein
MELRRFIDNISVTGIVSTDEIQKDEVVKVYPNPAENVISFHSDSDEYFILDMLGKDVSGMTQFQSGNGQLVHVDISELSVGTYYLRTGNRIAKFLKR